MLELLLINSVIWLVAKSLEWEMVTFATNLKAYSTVALLLQKQYSLHRIPRSRDQLGTMLWWTRTRTRMSSSSLLVKTESRAVANSIGSRLYPAWFPAFGAIHLQLHDTATLGFASSSPSHIYTYLSSCQKLIEIFTFEKTFVLIKVGAPSWTLQTQKVLLFQKARKRSSPGQFHFGDCY